MKTTITYLIFLLYTSLMLAQQKGYEIRDGQVIFTFDPRDYEMATDNATGKHFDFDDLNVLKVAVSGEFNGWNQQGWTMHKTGDNRYELRKPVEAFNDRVTWEFKYIINGRYWAEPDDRFGNLSKMRTLGFWREVYNLELQLLTEDPNGNSCFQLEGYQNAREVILSGSFNRWDEEQLKMKPVNNGWKLCLDLPPGTYQYKFIIDGDWIHDPGNPERTPNEFGEYNSVHTVLGKVHFVLNGHGQAKRVLLSGDFTQWQDQALPMEYRDGAWHLILDLKPGKHHYKFIIDGEWITDPMNPYREYDGRGNINSVLMVE